MTAAVQLPELDQPYALAPEQIAEYRSSGVTLLRGLAAPQEVAAYRPLIADAVKRFNDEARALEERDTYGMAFLQTMNLWARDALVKRFSFARRFAQVAAELMGVSGVRMYHDQALFKEPGGGPTPWHQDQYYWPLDTDHTITMWMPLVDIPAEVGTLTFARGSHTEGYLGKLPISRESDAVFRRFVDQKGYEVFSYGAMKAGDATFHTGWTLHAAPGNPSSDFMREVMTVIYFADGARVTVPDHENRENDLATWLPGLRPGDLAASPLNPLLYPA